MMVKSTMESVRKARMSQLLTRCLGVGIGTLWQVREDLWKERLPRYRSDREWHPGVSLRTKPVTSLQDVVPLLHGTSGQQGPVVMKGLSIEEGPDYPTSFGHLGPVPCSASDIVGKSLAQGIDPDEVVLMWPLASRRICRNPAKFNCTPTEKKALLKWASRRGCLK